MSNAGTGMEAVHYLGLSRDRAPSVGHLVTISVFPVFILQNIVKLVIFLRVSISCQPKFDNIVLTLLEGQ